MIPRPLADIDWADIQRLVEMARAEDDTIEFKRAFKGGDDFGALNEKAREQSLDSLSREVLAFLNTRGGDVLVGIRESEGPAPVAEEITTIANVHDTADRIARGLAAIIEPAQTDVSVRGIADPDDPSRGVLVMRVRSSIRAPHRSKRTRECFARRGSESVPMAMDEVQDLTLIRSRIRLEQLDLLDRQFADFKEGRAEHRYLGDHIFHIRTVAFPHTEQSIKIDDGIMDAVRNRIPVLYDIHGRGQQHDLAFRGLYSRWRPILRGKKQESFETYEGRATEFATPHYAAKILKESGICIFDYAQLADLHETPGIYSQWVLGYLAEVCESLRELWRLIPSLVPATVRIGVRAKGEVAVAYPHGWPDGIASLPESISFLPDTTVSSGAELAELFRQVQIDFFALLNLDLSEPYTLTPPQRS